MRKWPSLPVWGIALRTVIDQDLPFSAKLCEKPARRSAFGGKNSDRDFIAWLQGVFRPAVFPYEHNGSMRFSSPAYDISLTVFYVVKDIDVGIFSIEIPLQFRSS